MGTTDLEKTALAQWVEKVWNHAESIISAYPHISSIMIFVIVFAIWRSKLVTAVIDYANRRYVRGAAKKLVTVVRWIIVALMFGLMGLAAINVIMTPVHFIEQHDVLTGFGWLNLTKTFGFVVGYNIFFSALLMFALGMLVSFIGRLIVSLIPGNACSIELGKEDVVTMLKWAVGIIVLYWILAVIFMFAPAAWVFIKDWKAIKTIVAIVIIVFVIYVIKN